MLKLSDLKPGDMVIAGKDMPCLKAGLHLEVFEAPREYGGGLAVTCRHGPHLLAATAGKDGEVTQFSRAPMAAPRQRR
jgi:hypothetical protein